VHVVRSNEKRRFALSDDGRHIRASQGHSIKVELGYESCTPPERLYHGTVERFLPAIRREGLRRGHRHHVHLSPDLTTATQVGGRRGRPVILTIRARAMHEAGHAFYCSANNVWLTDCVPPEFIKFN
jgi:putative RNA 2'-phosphotransferase